MRSRRLMIQIVAAAALALATARPVLVRASTWKQIVTPTSPPAREYPAMAYDPVSMRVILFGGLGTAGNLNDTWAFDGTTWTEIQTTVAPPVRNGATMAFDRSTNKLVMFGGFDVDQYLQDTWLWDGATSTWTQARLKMSPPRATGAMLFTDPLSGRAMMFGGYNSFNIVPVYSNTWRWTGIAWEKLNPSTVPYPRAWGIATLDPLRHNVVLTGGNGDTIRTDNTWTWDGTNWTLLAPATQVQAYVGAGSAFDPAVHAVVVLGGDGATWSWNGTDWVQMAPAQSPSARTAIGMAYDPATHQALVFGGQLSTGNLVKQTWQLVGR